MGTEGANTPHDSRVPTLFRLIGTPTHNNASDHGACEVSPAAIARTPKSNPLTRTRITSSLGSDKGVPV